MMTYFDRHSEQPLYHGGSFNGNLLGTVAGAIALRDLTAADITRIDGQAESLKADIAESAQACGISVGTPGVGSAFGLYVYGANRENGDERPGDRLGGDLAAAPGGGQPRHLLRAREASSVSPPRSPRHDLEHVSAGLRQALADVAATHAEAFPRRRAPRRRPATPSGLAGAASGRSMRITSSRIRPLSSGASRSATGSPGR